MTKRTIALLCIIFAGDIFLGNAQINAVSHNSGEGTTSIIEEVVSTSAANKQVIEDFVDSEIREVSARTV